jgi:uncharacterized protein YgbK (DUF1537 family)
VHESPFARDRRFGFHTSFLPAWVEEKSGGRIAAASVERIGLAELVPERLDHLVDHLRGLCGNRFVAVDAEHPEHLRLLGRAVRRLVPERRLLVQSAASLLGGLADLPPQPLGTAALASLRRGVAPGAVLVGSHVPLTDLQLAELLAEPGCVGVELPLERVLAAWRDGGFEGGPGGGIDDGRSADPPPAALAALEEELGQRLGDIHRSGRTPVLFTSRGESAAPRLGAALAGLMARIARRLPPDLGYLISKGGTTSQTLLGEGLDLPIVRLEGQLLPGLSVLRLPPDHPLFPSLPLLTFPGNLGEAGTLRLAWQWMERGGPPLRTPGSERTD